MPEKPPSKAITRMIRMMVPIDISHFLQPGSQHLLLRLQPRERVGTHKVPLLQPRLDTRHPFFPVMWTLHKCASSRDFENVCTPCGFASASSWPRGGDAPPEGRIDARGHHHSGTPGR